MVISGNLSVQPGEPPERYEGTRNISREVFLIIVLENCRISFHRSQHRDVQMMPQESLQSPLLVLKPGCVSCTHNQTRKVRRAVKQKLGVHLRAVRESEVNVLIRACCVQHSKFYQM